MKLETIKSIHYQLYTGRRWPRTKYQSSCQWLESLKLCVHFRLTLTMSLEKMCGRLRTCYLFNCLFNLPISLIKTKLVALLEQLTAHKKSRDCVPFLLHKCESLNLG